MKIDDTEGGFEVNCRIGSLENHLPFGGRAVDVNCRIGSLEINGAQHTGERIVNCRIGSLETVPRWPRSYSVG